MKHVSFKFQKLQGSTVCHSMAGKITTIPATVNRFSFTPMAEVGKRKVAAYARVSTDHEEQQSSYEAQADYYTNYIKSREDWEFIGLYADV